MAKGIVGTRGTDRLPLKPLKDLPKRHREFIKLYVRSGNAEEAYVQAGYKANKPAAYKLRKDLQTYIADELNTYVKGTEMAILGLKVVREIAENSKNEMVKFNAAKELMARSLPEDAKEVHHVHQKAELTDDQLMSQIEKLRNKLMGSNVVPIKEIQKQ